MRKKNTGRRSGFTGALLATGSLLILAHTAGCSKEAEPLARLEVGSGELELGFPEFTSFRFVLEPLRPLPEGVEPQFFLHLLDEPGSVLRTFDQPLAAKWEVGVRIERTVRLAQSALAEPLAAGTYLLTAGLYDPANERYPLATPAREVARLEYQVAVVTVPPAGLTLPAVRFSDGWLEATPGQDRQILARRSLDGAGPATFQLGPLRGPGQILVRLSPAPGVVPGRVEIREGSNAPRVHLRSSCGAFEAEVSGELGVETILEVPPTEAEVFCDIEVAPNFTARVGVDGKLRSSALEILAWHAGSSDE